MRRRLRPAHTILAALALASCSTTSGPEATDLSDPGPRRTATLALVDGISEAIEFDVPPGTAALSILATSADRDVLIQLGSLTLAGDATYSAPRADRVLLSSRKRDHAAVTDPAGFVQEIQRGRFAFTYPFAPGWDLPTGPAAISFLTSGGTSLDVEVRAVESAARSILPVTVFAPGERTLSADARAATEAIFGEAGITVRWEDRTLPAWAPKALTDLDDRAGSYRLLADTVAAQSTGTVNVVIVDALPGGLSGVSTGIPGPHDGTGAAITVTFRDANETARLVAHEIAHLLGLRHLEDRSSDGVVVRNPISDTRADAYNLMQFGTNLTDGQVEILRLSPLLTVSEPETP